MTDKKYSNFMTYHEIARFLDVIDLDDLLERNRDWLFDIRNSVEQEAINDGASQTEAEQKGYDTEEETIERMYKYWKASLESTMEYLLERHDLGFNIIKKKGHESGIRITSSNWRASAAKILDTLNGVGVFYASSLKEFYETTSVKSYKELVLSHLHYILDYPKVYGITGADMHFENTLDDYLRKL